MKPGRQVGRRLRLGRALGLASGLLLATLLCLEGILQLGSLFVHGRGGAWRAGARVRVLCVGDSHTYGTGVKREESYPGQLQRLLDERSPGRYSVLNLGIPGLSTTQLRHRVPTWLARYEPDVLVVWAGVNNGWNTAETGEASSGLLEDLDRWLLRSRVYKLARVWLHDRSLERVVGSGAAGQAPRVEWDRRLAPGKVRRFTARYGDVEETIEHRGDGHEDWDRIYPRAVADLGEIAKMVRAEGVSLVLVTYPIDGFFFERANRAAWHVSEEYGVPLVNTSASLRRVPPERQQWLWANHPGAAIYAEIARDVARAILGALGEDTAPPAASAAPELRTGSR